MEEIYDEKNGITYHKEGDYYIPNLVVPKNDKNIKLGKYGLLRLKYLKNNNKALYQSMLIKNKLQKHLIYVDRLANERIEELIKELAKRDDITEELKSNNQMEWVGKMNNIKNCAEEIVLKEIIYS